MGNRALDTGQASLQVTGNEGAGPGEAAGPASELPAYLSAFIAWWTSQAICSCIQNSGSVRK